jgi:hypothetical protein
MSKAGLHRKYDVSRMDGSSGPGGKHEHCTYFVLDLEHDEFALDALGAYADACEETHPKLASDLRDIVQAAPSACSCREAFCPHTPMLGPTTPSEMAGYLMRKR